MRGQALQERAKRLLPRAGDLFQLFEKTRQAVGAVVEGVVTGKEIPGLGEEDDDHPHDHPYGGSVDLGRIEFAHCSFRLSPWPWTRISTASRTRSPRRPRVRLPLAALEDRLQERGWGVLGFGVQRAGARSVRRAVDLGGEGHLPRTRVPHPIRTRRRNRGRRRSDAIGGRW